MEKNWISEWGIIPVGSIKLSEYRLYRIMRAAGTPGSITWLLDPDGEYERRHLAWDGLDYGYWPVPLHPGHVCVFNPLDPDYPAMKAAGFGWLQDDVASCTYVPSRDSDLVIGLRIWHEVLHCMLSSGDADRMLQTPEFVPYLERKFGADSPMVVQFKENPVSHEHDPTYQKEFYTYLVETHFPEKASVPRPQPPLAYRIRDIIEDILAAIRRR
jgi:hypothetical protein